MNIGEAQLLSQILLTKMSKNKFHHIFGHDFAAYCSLSMSGLVTILLLTALHQCLDLGDWEVCSGTKLFVWVVGWLPLPY